MFLSKGFLYLFLKVGRRMISFISKGFFRCPRFVIKFVDYSSAERIGYG